MLRVRSSPINVLALTLALGICCNLAMALYLPYRRAVNDPDDDLMEVDASIDSPQGDEQEADNDGPYGETRRDEDNQADLEKFFDDHLGASEKDGMDNENLPTNAIPFILTNPTIVSEAEIKNSRLTSLQEAQSQLYGKEAPIDPTVRYDDDDDTPEQPRQRRMSRSNHHQYMHQQQARNRIIDPDNVAYRTVVKEDVDKDQGHFKIPALGGYDPEEDFRQQLHDMNNERPNIDISNQDIMDVQASGYDSKDIAFDSGPATKDEGVFNDGYEDPDSHKNPAGVDQNQLNQESTASEPMANEQEGTAPTEDEQQASEDNNDEGSERPPGPQARSDKAASTDSDEGAWVDDGIDDIEIPAQSQQDEANQASSDDSDAGQGPNEAQQGEENRRNDRNDQAERGKSGEESAKNEDDGDHDQDRQSDNTLQSSTHIRDANEGATGPNDHYQRSPDQAPSHTKVYEEAGVRAGPNPRKTTTESDVARNRLQSQMETPSKWTKDMHKAWADESESEWPGPPPLEE